MPKPETLYNLSEKSFSYSAQKAGKEVLWNEIGEIVAYKMDGLTTDLLCVDLILSKTVLTLPAEMEGWEQFVKIMQQVFPSIDLRWEEKIIQPPFEAKKTRFIKNNFSAGSRSGD